MNFKLYDLARLVLTISVIGLLPACRGTGERAEEQPTPTDPPTMDLLVDVPASRDMGYRVAWQNDLGIPAGQRIRSVTLLKDRIAVIESAVRGNLLTLIDEATGKVLWRAQIGAQFETLFPPTLDEDRLVIHSDSTLYFLRLRTGELYNKKALPYLTKWAGLPTAALMIYGTPTGRVYAQSLRTGNHVWSYQMGGSISAAPVDANGLAGMVDSNGGVGMVNFDGTIVWRTINPPWDEIIARPAYAQGTLLIASTDQKLYAFDRASGDPFWSFGTERPLTADPIVIGDRVFQHVPDRGLVALDLLDGGILWENRKLPAGVLKQRGNDLMIRSDAGIIIANVETGELLREVSLPMVNEVVVNEKRDGGPIYVTGNGGRIMKLAPRR